MPRVLITTVPFGQHCPDALDRLRSEGIEFVLNPLGRRLKEEELADLIGGFDLMIAGTEPITARVLARANRLRLISRVGIGLDSVDLLAARARGIHVSYTPEAPAPAVAELTLFLSWLGCGAQRYLEGRAYNSGKLGQKFFSERLTIRDDVTDTRAPRATA